MCVKSLIDKVDIVGIPKMDSRKTWNQKTKIVKATTTTRMF